MRMFPFLAIALCAILAFSNASLSQTTVFSDDFSTNKNAAFTTSGQIGASAFSVSRSGADWGARRSFSPEQLELTNDVGATANADGWVYANVPNSSFTSPYSPVLRSTPGLITWSFNLRQIRTDPSGFGTNTYGVAFILAGSSTNAATGGNGYAVVLGQTGTTDPVRFVRYSNGLQGTLNDLIISNTAGLADFATQYLTLRVTYNPSNSRWELFAYAAPAAAFVEPIDAPFVSQGTTIDSTYVNDTLGSTGAYWQGSTVASQTAFFDNISVTVTPQPGALSLNSATSSVNENATLLSLTVSRIGGLSGTVGASYGFADGTATGGASCATAGVDYINTGGSVSFLTGEASKTIDITICNDATFEVGEDFTVSLSSTTGGATLGSLSSSTVTIQNDDSQTWTVTNTADPGDGVCDSVCTLREAIAAASSGDVIAFSSLFNSAQEIVLGSELLISSKNLTITGPGANVLTVNGGPGSNRIFTLNSSVVALGGLTLTGGNGSGSISSGDGGAIYVGGGQLLLDSVHITGNSAVTNGGGILFNGGTGHLISRSTLSGNTVANCGGFFLESGSVTVTNSTISGNTVTDTGGGFCSNDAVTVRNSTITSNTAGGNGGGIFTFAALDIGSTIVAGNSAASRPEIWVSSGTFVSSGFNLIGDSAGDSTNTGNLISYQTTDVIDTNPQLEPLALYAGTVPTHALGVSPASPAFDKGNSFGLVTDQRGFNRTFDDPAIANAVGGDGTDIGAFERLSPSAAKVSISGRVVSAMGFGLQGVRVILEGPGLEVPRVVISSSFGYYTFEDVEAGQGYFLRVETARQRFASASRFVMLTDSLTDADFVAEPFGTPRTR
jgi:CSLREA domain-containing protein